MPLLAFFGVMGGVAFFREGARLMQASCASSSIQREPEDTIPSERDPRSSVRQAVPEANVDTWPAPPPSLERESRPTVPYARAARFLFGHKRRAALLDELEDEETESGRPVREWAVDDGPEVRALSTFELWMALARGEIGPKTRVWRDGMEGWESVEDVPELAYALLDSVSFDPPIVTPGPMPANLVTRSDARTPRTPLTFGSAEAETLDPPEVGGSSEPISRPLRSGRRPRLGFSGAVSFALGCLVAVSAVGFALAHRGGAEMPEVVSRLSRPLASLVAPPLSARPGLGDVALLTGQRVVEATPRKIETPFPVETVETPFVAPPPPSARVHVDPGQRRSRRTRRR